MDPDTSAPVLEAEEFCCMFTTRLENTSILFGAEMDGIESSTVVDLTKTNPNDLKFTELKVRMKPLNQRLANNFDRFKSRNWWCQSHLTNIPKIIVGFRTENGIVDELKTINVESMPRMYEVTIHLVCLGGLSTYIRFFFDAIFTRDVDPPWQSSNLFQAIRPRVRKLTKNIFLSEILVRHRVYGVFEPILVHGQTPAEEHRLSTYGLQIRL